MSEQLYRQTVHTDGGRGHWFAYEPAIELVRCRECRYYEPEYTWTERHGPGMYEEIMEPPCCKLHWHDPNEVFPDGYGVCYEVEPDGFCAWGEGKHGMDR